MEKQPCGLNCGPVRSMTRPAEHGDIILLVSKLQSIFFMFNLTDCLIGPKLMCPECTLRDVICVIGDFEREAGLRLASVRSE